MYDCELVILVHNTKQLNFTLFTTEMGYEGSSVKLSVISYTAQLPKFVPYPSSSPALNTVKDKQYLILKQN